MKNFKILVQFNAPQVKLCIKPNTENVCKLPEELPNDLKFRITRNWEVTKKIYKMGESRAQYAVSFTEKKLLPMLKNYTKTDIKLFSSKMCKVLY